MGAANKGKPRIVFDWLKAALLVAAEQPDTAAAGLSGDWEYPGGTIYSDGAPVPEGDTYVYLPSTWADARCFSLATKRSSAGATRSRMTIGTPTPTDPRPR